MKYLFLMVILIGIGCNSASMEKEMEALKNELSAAKESIGNLKSQIEPEGNLVHIVFFKLQPEADLEGLIAEIKKLEEIEEVMDLEVGPFEDLEDARALSEYSLMMSMSFKDAATYQAYQKHPIHLALREKAKPYMEGPPATYDFVKK